ncbi:MAG: UDP-glucose 4-epimerase GalE [Firmicutes bacterium]|nr:UDP-glucose 4-epimerase GalE [Bacillota bacterium]
MSILVTGGAGYIGSHCVKALLRRGDDAVIIDNLGRGHREAVLGGRFYEGDLGDRVFLEGVFQKERIDAVFHFAALSLVGESVETPELYFSNNVGAGLTLIETALKFGKPTIVFSSTAAVYGEPTRVPIEEDDPQIPKNPYGESKQCVERILQDCAAAHGLKYAALRYFNVAGADADAEIGEAHEPETHLIPCILQAAQENRPVRLFGTDYPTPDGTCIRDYIDVGDLIDAHLLALDYLKNGGEPTAFNLGSGKGFSNLEIINAARAVTGIDIQVQNEPRRAGDPAVLLASSQKAMDVLGWRPRYTDIEEIIRTAWNWSLKRRY